MTTGIASLMGAAGGALSSAIGGASATSSSAPTLSEADFLRILTAEVQNQDPTTPVDPTQFASQLVQFADFGELQSINNTLQNPPQPTLAQSAAAYVGRSVVASGNQIGVASGKATSILFTPPVAGNYTAIIANASGTPVASVTLKNLQAGQLQTFTWNPPSSTPSGTYTVSIVGANGAPVTGLQEMGVVQTVSTSQGSVVLNLGGLVIPASAVTAIGQVSAAQ